MTTELTTAVDLAARVLGPLGSRDEPLAPMTTYKVGGTAALFVRARTVDDLLTVAAARRASELPVLVVGRGSNLLVADEGFAGIGVSIADFAAGIEIDGTGLRGRGTQCMVTAGGGAALPVVARRTAAAALTGFEWAVGVPGSIGGAVRMNAGGHGSDMAACIADADVVDLDGQPPRPSCDGLSRISACASAARTSATTTSWSRHACGSSEAIAGPPRRRSPTSCAGGASTSRVGRTAARCSSTPCPAR